MKQTNARKIEIWPSDKVLILDEKFDWVEANQEWVNDFLASRQKSDYLVMYKKTRRGHLLASIGQMNDAKKLKSEPL